ncbi:alpha/beta fold hydrolase [Streptomyces halstedii]|uniref:alpha/beta fold hydrolase n=1 Tax=Streptomyces TaxID=1883 RepID=UPI0004919F34|nr:MULTISPECIES: alpha/beta fold hydrolase [Streptomyces]MYR74991.1 alpha/beta fold hydrolase [Streptomyces sp. SID4925]MYY15277.1 alpha/beta fold hydrolase [Streptomyces sp. SID4912]SBU90821.1 Lysophospholipase, alpha-beta hydrolase superfamily [Streptomyces sp. OspMP-M45]SCE02467.1 Lysophospholipase, alpha-beta hydrolase superfamily [Streptomyces sp. DpondAA-D4]
MSRPPTFVPPPCARARVLATGRGDFAVLDAAPRTPAHATALLLPGYTGSKEDFVALLEPLTDAGFRVVSVDGRGQYETPGPDQQSAYAQVELARDVLAQADALGAERPVHLLGHSLGGQIARAAVLLDAAPFRSLTLMSSGPAEIVPAQQKKARMLSDALAGLTMDEVWTAMRELDPPEDADTDDGEDLRRRWLRHNPAQLIATGAQLSTEPDRVDELAALGLPVHVVSGESDDVWPVPSLDAMARRLGARRTVIEGAEHSPNTARPGPTAAALAAFWNTV